MRWWLVVIVALLVTLSPCYLVTLSSCQAHPVPQRNHDRVVVVRLTADAVVVDYHLEVDEFTVVFVDLPALDEKLNLAALKPKAIYDRFTELYAPVLADGLDARLDGQPLKLTCIRRGQKVVDSVQSDFRFQAAWQPEPGKRHTFTFQEGTFVFPDRGQTNVSLTGNFSVVILEKNEATPVLKALPYTDLKPGDEERLRQASALFEVPVAEPKGRLKLDSLEGLDLARAEYKLEAGPQGTVPKAASKAAPTEAVALLRTTPPPDAEPEEETPATSSRYSLRALLDSGQGFWMLMFLAACVGAGHALTPGHGKTLVAAYLVGERGTVWHALLLGLVTTLTHTGSVLAIAVGLYLFFPNASPAHLQTALGLFGGLLVAGLGFWLLLRRLSGQADHIHLSGHSHHHPHDPIHDDQGHAHAPQRVGLWGLIVLGISGGIVPCWDAILLLGYALMTQRLWLGPLLLLAFSAGLAAVLIAIGMAVVSVKGLATSRFGDNRLFKALPVVSAILVMGMGLWLCYESLHPETAVPARSASSRP